jgi:hypothetical protein
LPGIGSRSSLGLDNDAPLRGGKKLVGFAHISALRLESWRR